MSRSAFASSVLDVEAVVSETSAELYVSDTAGDFLMLVKDCPTEAVAKVVGRGWNLFFLLEYSMVSRGNLGLRDAPNFERYVVTFLCPSYKVTLHFD